jgi:hypothetical protein
VIFACCTNKRRDAVLADPAALNGIDYLEVLGQDTPAAQQTLLIHCLNPVPTTLTLTPDNVMIQGGESVTQIGVVSIAASASTPNVLTVTTNVVGDFSPYELRLVGSALHAAGDPFDVTEVLPGFDPQLAAVQFYFRTGTGPSFDCAPPPPNCPVPETAPPPINYIAKDYGSFRTLILDRLNQLLPSAVGNNEADLAIVLAELIAYQADQLSYQQDAIATEAYIQTARSRVSLRRHARLVDYQVHDGCNARAWIQLTVAANANQAVFMDRTLTRFYTYAPGMPTTLAVGAKTEQAALAAGVQVFQPLHDALLYPEHNLINFYTWGESQCCLAAGTVEATLQGRLPNLQPGDVLIFQEVLGPQTGLAADADLRHRCVVRLTQVANVNAADQPLVDPLFDENGLPITSGSQTPMPVTQIQWAAGDALPFPVCISSIYIGADGVATAATNVSVALGNVVLADHGLGLSDIPLGIMPPPRFYYPATGQAASCLPPSTPVPLPVGFRPTVQNGPLTQAVPQPVTGSPSTSGVVMLGPSGGADLVDASGLVSLQVQGSSTTGWPALFGVTVQQNTTNTANFNLTVSYLPSAGAAGVSPPPVVEQFTSLSLNPADPNFAPSQINYYSNLLRVPSSYAPPTTAPAGYPAAPTPLPASGTVSLTDTSTPPITFLVLESTSPLGWPAAIGILSEVAEGPPLAYDVDVVYYPGSAVGVTLPVTLERFTAASQDTLVVQINAGSSLVGVLSFAGMPDLTLSAQDLMNVDASDAVPAITLQGTLDETTTVWNPRQDLLANGPADPVFVVEVDSDGTASVRFATPADPSSPLEANGLVPASGTVFVAQYRIGNGGAGNVGAESLKYLAAGDARIQTCLNPLPASGGTDPETDDQIRRRAPQAFLSQAPSTLVRSITMADYEAIAENNPLVDQAMASLRWTGSWYSAFIAVEPTVGGNLTPALQQALTETVNTYRLAGQDIQLESPQYVALQIALTVNVANNYFRSDVEQALLQVLGNQMLPGGKPGLFYPGNFTFGGSVYLSPVYAAARGVAGVVTVTATQFQPQGPWTTQYLTAGVIKLGSLQIARLDNDPSFPTHGQLILTMQGGK